MSKTDAISVIKNKIKELVFNSPSRLTQRDVEKEVLKIAAIEKEKIRTAIRELIDENELSYTFNLGCSFLEPSFNRPVHISKKTVLKPEGILYESEGDKIVIELQSGVSFGNGQHPTTRLCLQAIEYALRDTELLMDMPNSYALDIGSGSGILAIAAVLSGISQAIGIDIDPCARVEAKHNIILNGLENRIQILDGNIDSIERKFSLILANLRYPTLISLYSTIDRLTEAGGIIILSGIKNEEISGLRNIYLQQRFHSIWNKCEKGWACEIFQKLDCEKAFPV